MADKLYLASVRILLTVSAVTKLTSFWFWFSADNDIDPFLFVTRRESLLLVSIVEVLIVTLLCMRLSIISKLAIIIWLGACFLAYQAVSALFPFGGAACACFGLLPQLLSMNSADLRLITTAASLYMTVGSFLILYRHTYRNVPLDGGFCD